MTHILQSRHARIRVSSRLPHFLLPLLFISFVISLPSSILCAKRFDPSAPAPNPNPPPPEVVRERNARRFPGAWLPEGYDVGEAAVTGSASSETLWMSPSGERARSEPRVWFERLNGAARPPGKLLLNMLVMNEAENLARTLPYWKDVIDYWIIGVDEKNTDDSIEIVKRNLGHLPGEIALVRGFDGHGPTWTTLVSLGIEHFPGATHGIIADADFRPMNRHFDRYELDIRCSKHMYTIWTQDHRNERRMDWIYRNIPGARVTRRTHQVVEVPPLPDQEVFQTLVNLPLDEREGGWGDRSGNKQDRYIAWLSADLIDFPDDPRTLYYLGYGHLDKFNTHGGHPTQLHWDALHKSVEYFERRVNLPKEKGNKEERWFALLKLAEIHERFLGQWDKAEAYYRRCIELDGERADPYFYLGQHYRLVGQHREAEPLLYTAATIPMPVRSLFQWHYLYRCLSKLEYGRNHVAMSTPTLKKCRRSVRILHSADCSEGDPGDGEEVKRLIDASEKELKVALERVRRKKMLKQKKEMEEKHKQDEEDDKKSKKKKRTSEVVTSRSHRSVSDIDSFLSNDRKISTARSLLDMALSAADALESASRRRADKAQRPDGSDASKRIAQRVVDLYADFMMELQHISNYLAEFNGIDGESDVARQQQVEFLTCRRYRMATAPYVNLYENKQQQIKRLLRDDAKAAELDQASETVRALCR